ncbi:hypothetical protein CR513_32959, partial [Mucuna pruriens]
MTRWAVELSKFDITCERRGHVKAQVFADFINELTPNSHEEEATGANREWTLSVDRSSNKRGSKAGVILEGPKNWGMKMLTVKSDSKLVIGQVNGEYQAKDL